MAAHTPVRAALLGSGIFASTSYLPALPSVPGLQIATIWSRSESSVSTLASKAAELSLTPAVEHGEEGLERILADESIQAVIMVLPIGAQPDLIRRCWKAGKHVISEKPVGRDVKQAKELVEEGERMGGLVWRVAENFAHEPLIHEAAALLADPAVGPVLFWKMHFETMLPDGVSYHATKWRTVPDYQGGFLLDGGVHWAALARVVLPERARPHTITAHKSLHRAHMPPHDTLIGFASPKPDATIEARGQRTSVEGTMKEEDMPVQKGNSTPFGSFTLTWALPDTDRSKRVPNELYVVCENATLRLTNLGRAWSVSFEPGAGSSVKPVYKEAKGTGIEVELAEFAAAVAAKIEGKEEGVNNGAPRAALWDVGFIEAALESEGRPREIGVELERKTAGEKRKREGE